MSNSASNMEVPSNLPLSILVPISIPGVPMTSIDDIITTDSLPTPFPSLLNLSPPSISAAPTPTTNTTTTSPTTNSNLTNSTYSSVNTASTHSSNLSFGAWLGIGLCLALLLVIAVVYSCLWLRKRNMESVGYLEETEPRIEVRGRLGREARVVAGGTATRGFEVTRRGGDKTERGEAERRQVKRVVGAREVVVGMAGSEVGEGKQGNRRWGSDGKRYTDSLVDGIRKDQIGIALGGEEKEKMVITKEKFGDENWESDRRMKSGRHEVVAM